MGYSVDTWETDFYIPPNKIKEALADINADPALQRPCWNRAHNAIGEVAEHDCQRTKPFDSLAEAVEELTGFHDCEESETTGFRLGYHLDKWHDDDVLYTLGKYAAEGSFVRFMGEDNELFGYRVSEGKLRTEEATVTWTLSPVWARMEDQ
jgi:hypothetical protein